MKTTTNTTKADHLLYQSLQNVKVKSKRRSSSRKAISSSNGDEKDIPSCILSSLLSYFGSLRIVQQMAMFGDSGLSLMFSFLLLLLAMWMVYQPYINNNNNNNNISTTTGSSMSSSGSIQSRGNGPPSVAMEKGWHERYTSLGPIPDVAPTHIYQLHIIQTNSRSDQSIQLTQDMQMEWQRDGVICVRGLINAELMQKLDQETEQMVQEEERKKEQQQQSRANTKNHIDSPRNKRQSSSGGTQFHTVIHSALFRQDNLQFVHNNKRSSLNHVESNKTERILSVGPSALMQVAIGSPIAEFAALLLQLNQTDSDIICDSKFTLNSKDNNNNNNMTKKNNNEHKWDIHRLRVIRDIFLTKDDDAYVCGWHVDDMGFWPAIPESSGVNAWIALDDMDVTEETGGLAVAVQSHTAPWRHEAYYHTGASRNYPSHGYVNASDFFAQRTGQGTCHLQQAAPHLHQRMEELSRIYPVKRGDVVFHTRWLFHRTVAITKKRKHSDQHPVYRRYSIRYGFGEQTIIPPGYGTELSVLWNISHGGLSADEICDRDGPWYPQAWPPLLEENETDTFYNDLYNLVRDKMSIAVKRRAERIQEMKPYLQQIAKQQHQLSIKT